MGRFDSPYSKSFNNKEQRNIQEAILGHGFIPLNGYLWHSFIRSDKENNLDDAREKGHEHE